MLNCSVGLVKKKENLKTEAIFIHIMILDTPDPENDNGKGEY